MTSHGTKEYRQDMAAIHEEVVRTGKPTIVTKDGKPYVKIVPALEEDVLHRLREAGAIVLPSARRQTIEPIDAGGDDSTEVIGKARG
ncbi:hypothetical protein [Amycolatopsis samaneae]|uniref:Antitoxin n=1 Tax=Amycolatopsis samaneae TaxID=664691 RepID=A0ABW5G9N6_9PSEU